MFDVVIIGAGVTGASIARELSKYELKIAVIEKGADVCEGTSKANSGIVHAGFDAKPGSLKAKLNVLGNKMMPELSKELDFTFVQNGSMVLCFDESGRDAVQELYDKGIKNGVEKMQILSKEEALKIEPNLTEDFVCALWAPTGGIVCPFELTIALAENAFVNGAEFYFDTAVTGIEKKDKQYTVITDKGSFETKVVINAAGMHSDEIHNMVSSEKVHLIARKGEYCLYDKQAGSITGNTIFQLPTKYGKGILVTPTAHGNLLVGPTAVDVEEKEGVNTTAEGLAESLKKAAISVKQLPSPRQIITSFAGMRAHLESGDFRVELVEGEEGFIDALGVESPGLTCAPAMGEYVAGIVLPILKPDRKQDFISKRVGVKHLAHMSKEEKEKLIAENPKYANIVCRCESISEGEILDAIHRPLGATTLDGVKRRTRAGMGRCQAGFCTPKTMDILSRELSVDAATIRKNSGKSQLLCGEAKNKEYKQTDNKLTYTAEGIEQVDVVIIGGGPAGLAAALAAKEAGSENILILERDTKLGGILNQCIHNGFGLHTFKEELTGPEYAARFIEKVKDAKIPYALQTMVMDISPLEDGTKIITAMNKVRGLFTIKAKAVVLAMGCRERSRGALNIPGYRPAGIYAAGTAQRFVNIEGRLPGKEVVILGSGDIGLIMARRLTFEGIKVKAVAELMPYSGGLKRNIVQCLNDYDIPLLLSHTVVDIQGKERVEGITLAQVDEKMKPIPGTEQQIPCDTLLLSVGLIPENELSTMAGVTLNPVTSGPVVNESFETNIPGVFACGNVLHVHDLVDYVSQEAGEAGRCAAEYVKSDKKVAGDGKTIQISAKDGVRYTVPSTIHTQNMQEEQVVRFRVGQVFSNVKVYIKSGDTVLKEIKKRTMAPGEMEQVKLKKSDLEALTDNTLTIGVTQQ